MCEGHEGGSLAKLFPTPSLQRMSPLPHLLRSPDKYDPLILIEKLGPKAHCFPYLRDDGENTMRNFDLLEIFKTFLPHDTLYF